MANPDEGKAPRVKGAALIGIFKYIKGRPGGEELLKKLLESLPPGMQPLFNRRVIRISEYPYNVFVALLRAMDKLTGSGDLSLCRKFGGFAAIQDFQSIYNMYQKRANPKDLSSDSNLVWQSYYINCGGMESHATLPGQLLIRIHDFPKMDPAHCRLMEGWMTQAIIETGGYLIEAVHEIKCNSKGDLYHEFVGKWKD